MLLSTCSFVRCFSKKARNRKRSLAVTPYLGLFALALLRILLFLLRFLIRIYLRQCVGHVVERLSKASLLRPHFSNDPFDAVSLALHTNCSYVYCTVVCKIMRLPAAIRLTANSIVAPIGFKHKLRPRQINLLQIKRSLRNFLR